MYMITQDQMDKQVAETDAHVRPYTDTQGADWVVFERVYTVEHWIRVGDDWGLWRTQNFR